MRPYFNTGHAFTWWFKFLGIPLTFGYVTCKLLDHFVSAKRRATLNGKVVVITGASSGIGEALAHVFYECGSKVVLAARRKTELERVKNDLVTRNVPNETLEPLVLELDLADYEYLDTFVEKVYDLCGHIDILINNGGVSHRGSILYTNLEPNETLEPLVLELDLADYEYLDTFVEKVYDLCGHIDILINNGGVSHRGSILYTNLEVYKKIMSINYFGSVALTKACLPKMVQRKSGHIVFVSSVQGLIAIPDRSAYAASKHAMQAFGDCLRAEMDQYNINVTVISPGYIKTAVSLNALTGSGDSHGVMDSSTAAGFTPEYTAGKMLNAIVNKKNDFIISQFAPNLAITLRHVAPSLYFWIMAQRANKTTKG